LEQLIGDPAPLSPGAFSVVLRERGSEEGGHRAAALAARMGDYVLHEVDATALLVV
jgi:hypothetical protein